MLYLLLDFSLFLQQFFNILSFILQLLNFFIQSVDFPLFLSNFVCLYLYLSLNQALVDGVKVGGGIVFDKDESDDEIVPSMIFFLIFFNFKLKMVLYEIVFHKLVIRLAVVLISNALFIPHFNTQDPTKILVSLHSFILLFLSVHFFLIFLFNLPCFIYFF